MEVLTAGDLPDVVARKKAEGLTGMELFEAVLYLFPVAGTSEMGEQLYDQDMVLLLTELVFAAAR